MVDVGFIKWSKGATTVAQSNTEVQTFDSSNPSDVGQFYGIMSTSKALNLDLLRLNIDETAAKSRTTHLNSSLVLGADYSFMEDKLSVGVLYTNYFARITNESELTMSVKFYKPNNLVGLTASYSPICAAASPLVLASARAPCSWVPTTCSPV